MYTIICVMYTKLLKNFLNYIVKIRNIHQNNFSTNDEIIK